MKHEIYFKKKYLYEMMDDINLRLKFVHEQFFLIDQLPNLQLLLSVWSE